MGKKKIPAYDRKKFCPAQPALFVSRHRWCLDVSFVCASCTHIFNFFDGVAVCDLIQSTQRSALGPSPGQGTSKPHFGKKRVRERELSVNISYEIYWSEVFEFYIYDPIFITYVY